MSNISNRRELGVKENLCFLSANSILTSKSKIELMKLKFVLVIAIIFAVLAVPAYSQLTLSGKTCSGNSLCESQTTCDSTGVCSTTLLNCASCGTAVKACPDGSVATAPNVCVGGVGQAECRPGVPQCRSTGTQEATKVLPFAVFTKKGFVVNITPAERKAIAGTAVEYEINVENQNPIQLTLQIGRQVPKGWTSEGPASLSLGPKSKDRFVLTVSSNISANDGTYAIAVIFFNPELNIVSTATAKYTIASRGAPALTITPRSQDGVPGQTVFFTVTVSNNDPPEFDAASFLLQPSAPPGWTATFNNSLLKIAPGQQAETTMMVKVPQNISEGETAKITVNATSGRVSTEAFADVKVSLCGNGVCDLNEVCDVDCPAEQFFTCAFGNGRCEQEIDDGVEYSAIPSFALNRFIVCNRNAKEEDCLKAASGGRTNASSNCGFGKPCLCTSDIASQCNMRCVDNKGVYYLYATGVSEGKSSFRSEANYSFTCPFVNLPEIIQTRNAFSNARDNYEKAKSALGEAIKIAVTDDEKAKLQPCFDALGIIIGLSRDHINLLDAVVKSPAVSNTTSARARTAEVRAEIETLFNTNCRGATGLLQIRRIISPGGAEKGSSILSTVDIRNIGDTTYFGKVQCDYVAPSQQRSGFESSCTEFPPNVIRSFTPVANATEAGLWKLQCKVFGSLHANCSSAEIHDFDEALFNVSTREAFVVDVFGFCSTTGIECEVRSNTEAACTQCFLGNISCQKQSQDGTLSIFRCPATGVGFSDLTGRVFATPQCVPVEPQQKTATVLCEGCGDAIVSGTEQCELPNTDNNQICPQNATTCNGKRFGQRDAAGFCTGSCLCSNDQFAFGCQTGKCGATCNDGQTRNITLTKPGGTCVCQQQCADTCEFSTCDCEAGSVCGNGICQAGETAANCPADCSAGKCGNGICESGETPATCSKDCAAVAQQCAIKITSQSCSFVAATNRYEVRLGAEWKGGDHAHSIVEDDPSQKFTNNFSTTHSMAGPGLKAIKVEVHNATDGLICFNASQVQCLPGGTTTGKLVDVVRQVPDATNGVVRTGAHIVNLQVAPYSDISGFQLREHVESGIIISNFVYFGNTSPVAMTTVPIIETDKTFTQYLFTTNLRATRNITIQYTMSTTTEKTYTLYWKYTALGQEVSEQPRMLLSVVDCAQTFPVYAIGPSGTCLQYSNSCKVPQSWNIVTECPIELDDRIPVTTTEDSPWLIILIVVLVIIVIILIKYRDRIKERLGREEEGTEEGVELEEE